MVVSDKVPCGSSRSVRSVRPPRLAGRCVGASWSSKKNFSKALSRLVVAKSTSALSS